MNNAYSSPTYDRQEELDQEDEYPKITQTDLDRVEFRIGLKSAPAQERVDLLLDKALLDYFKAKAGEEGYQALINETLRRAIAVIQ